MEPLNKSKPSYNTFPAPESTKRESGIIYWCRRLVYGSCAPLLSTLQDEYDMKHILPLFKSTKQDAWKQVWNRLKVQHIWSVQSILVLYRIMWQVYFVSFLWICLCIVFKLICEALQVYVVYTLMLRLENATTSMSSQDIPIWLIYLVLIRAIKQVPITQIALLSNTITAHCTVALKNLVLDKVLQRKTKSSSSGQEHIKSIYTTYSTHLSGISSHLFYSIDFTTCIAHCFIIAALFYYFWGYTVACTVSFAFFGMLMLQFTTANIVGNQYSKWHTINKQCIDVLHTYFHSLPALSTSNYESQSIRDIISKLRQQELGQIWTYLTFHLGHICIHTLTPNILFLSALYASYSFLSSVPFNITNIFTVLYLCTLLAELVRTIIKATMALHQANASWYEFLSLMQYSSAQQRTLKATPYSAIRLVHSSALRSPTTALSSSTSTIYQPTPFDVQIKPGEFRLIQGVAKSGKSALCEQLVLGSTGIKTTSLHITPLQVSYCAQKEWIYQGTIRENIIVHHSLDLDRYALVLRCCGLDTRLLALEEGDATVIGHRGVQLSKEFTTRIQIARTCYSVGDVYVFDSVLEQIDDPDALILDCRQAGGVLYMKSIVCFSASTFLAPYADKIQNNNNGRLINSAALSPQRRRYSTGTVDLKRADNMSRHSNSVSITTTNSAEMPTEVEIMQSGFEPLRHRSSSSFLLAWNKYTDTNNTDRNGSKSKLVRSSQSLTTIFWPYSNKFTLFVCSCTVFLQCTAIVVFIYSTYWTATWVITSNTAAPTQNLQHFGLIYSGIVITSCIVVSIRMYILTWFYFNLSHQVWQQVMQTIFTASSSFYIRLPIGQALNWFQDDITQIDTRISSICNNLVSMVHILAIPYIICTCISPLYTILLLPLLVCWFKLHSIYKQVTMRLQRQLRQYQSSALTLLTDCLDGQVTIMSQGETCRQYFIQSHCYTLNWYIQVMTCQLKLNQRYSYQVLILHFVIIIVLGESIAFYVENFVTNIAMPTTDSKLTIAPSMVVVLYFYVLYVNDNGMEDFTQYWVWFQSLIETIQRILISIVFDNNEEMDSIVITSTSHTTSSLNNIDYNHSSTHHLISDNSRANNNKTTATTTTNCNSHDAKVTNAKSATAATIRTNNFTNSHSNQTKKLDVNEQGRINSKKTTSAISTISTTNGINRATTSTTTTTTTTTTNADIVLVKPFHIHYDNISLQYYPQIPILQSVSFSIHSNDKIGLIGKSNTGKTTLLNALFPSSSSILLHSNSGAIYLNDINIQTIPVEYFATLCCHVSNTVQVLQLYCIYNQCTVRDYFNTTTTTTTTTSNRCNTMVYDDAIVLEICSTLMLELAGDTTGTYSQQLSLETIITNCTIQELICIVIGKAILEVPGILIIDLDDLHVANEVKFKLVQCINAEFVDSIVIYTWNHCRQKRWNEMMIPLLTRVIKVCHGTVITSDDMNEST